jgi:hypothetical protein
MMCVVAVMNRRGVALAANVTETLLPIAPDVPVAIVSFGANDMMGVPWETIVRMYARQLGTRTFATLEEYAASLFAFVEGSNALFPPQLQAERMRRCVTSLWADYRARIDAIAEERATTSAAELRDELATILREDRGDCEHRPEVAGLGEGFGSRVLATHGEQIDELEYETFGDMQLTQELRAELRSVLALMYEKEWCHPHDESGIALAGMGDDEPFPSVLVYSVGTVVAGRLRHMRRQSANIAVDLEATVVPFAHRETIDTIVDGIHPDLIGAICDMQAHVEEHTAPFMAAVAHLPRREMVGMAQALVTVSTFGEPASVAMLSKAGGFDWLTHDNPARYPSQGLYYGTARSE